MSPEQAAPPVVPAGQQSFAPVPSLQGSVAEASPLPSMAAASARASWVPGRSTEPSALDRVDEFPPHTIDDRHVKPTI